MIKLLRFATAYADQVEHDFQSFVKAVQHGRIEAHTDDRA